MRLVSESSEHGIQHALIAFPHITVENLIRHGYPPIQDPFFLLPPHVKYLWIYEESPIDAITCYIRLTRQGIPLHLYQLPNPIVGDHQIKQCLSIIHRNPIYAPEWLVHQHFDHYYYIW